MYIAFVCRLGYTTALTPLALTCRTLLDVYCDTLAEYKLFQPMGRRPFWYQIVCIGHVPYLSDHTGLIAELVGQGIARRNVYLLSDYQMEVAVTQFFNRHCVFYR